MQDMREYIGGCVYTCHLSGWMMADGYTLLPGSTQQKWDQHCQRRSASGSLGYFIRSDRLSAQQLTTDKIGMAIATSELEYYYDIAGPRNVTLYSRLETQRVHITAPLHLHWHWHRFAHCSPHRPYIWKSLVERDYGKYSLADTIE